MSEKNTNNTISTSGYKVHSFKNRSSNKVLEKCLLSNEEGQNNQREQFLVTTSNI